MTQDEILDMFRQQSANMSDAFPQPNSVILELAQLLADSRGRLSKENFETLVRIGGVLYKEGLDQFDARSDIAKIMKKSGTSRKQD